MLKALAMPPDCPTVIGSDARLSQAIAELIKNAIVYTPEGGTVTLAVRTEEEEKEGQQPWVTITVRDDGPGIPPEEYGQLFDPFFRGEAARTADIPGTGLGLAIVKEIVEQHGGTVTVESAPGEGTAFTLWLPASSHTSE
jgi:two-component system OmpR family sensor kinase